MLALTPDCAYACSCEALSGSPGERAERAFSGATAVFAGEVVGVEERPLTSMVEGTVLHFEGAPATISLRVSEVWKGPERGVLEVETSGSDSACGYPFRSGEGYLVYAGEGMSVSLCSETKPLSAAGADLEALGEVERLKSCGTLPDTSGGLSVPGLIGLAVLMAAVSFAIAGQFPRS